jgi:hypothetical protein
MEKKKTIPYIDIHVLNVALIMVIIALRFDSIITCVVI